jgi:hypothetical protein
LTLAERIAGEDGLQGLGAELLGVGGFLLLSPGHQTLISEQAVDISQIESCWHTLVQEYGFSPISAPAWNLNRVRPLNHPARRLASMAWLLNVAAADGLLACLMHLPLDDGASWDRWLAGAQPAIGESRRRQIVVNTIAPFVAAYADATGDQPLMEQIGSIWERLPGSVDDDIARKTVKQIVGERRFPVRSALEVQGLHQIGRQGCAHLRCFECPIATLAVQFEEQQLNG